MTLPIRLPNAGDRRRRRRLAVILLSVGMALVILFTFVVVRAVTRPGVDVGLGDETFRVGSTERLAARIVADDYPLLFQDLRDNSIDLFVDHDRSQPANTGWRAFEAHAPGAPRRCQLRWDRQARNFVDPCDQRRFPATGEGLRSFRVIVQDETVTVDFRQSRAD